MKTQENTRMLFVPLTREEVEVAASQLANAVQEVDELKARKKDLTAELSLKEKRLVLTRTELGDKVKHKRELRSVDVIRRANVDLRTWEIVRKDTNAIVSSEAMSDLEVAEHRQGKLSFISGGKDEKKKASGILDGHGETLSATVEEHTEGDLEACTNCKAQVTDTRKGRCRPCADFLRRHGSERVVTS